MGFLDIFKAGKIKAENEELKKKLDELGYSEYDQVKQHNLQVENEIQIKLSRCDSDIKEKIRAAEKDIENKNDEINWRNTGIEKLKETQEELRQGNLKIDKQLKTSINKLNKSKELYKSIEYCVNKFLEFSPEVSKYKIPSIDIAELDSLSPSVILKLHSMDVKELRKSFRQNDKDIEKILNQYSSRYTTKANQAIYKLMVIALRAELQNILYDLKYEKLDEAIENVKNTTAKYLQIAADGNQSIAGTMTKFIGELEYLFINAVKIEYNYYVKKEQAKQEQLAIREQMRQEAEERKALELEKKKIEAEEQKYKNELEKISVQLETASEEERVILEQRSLELQSQLSDVVIKKEDIAKLANGKAGNVYVISNLGSFGENVFKIGMTRRIDPQLRVDELGDASVPFRFDVHSFIFSDDAVGLENKLHEILNNRRVNKVNLRKEFFNINVNELEQLVQEIEPTAEFNKTMAAEEFRQSLSTDEVYTSDYTSDEEELED